MPLTAAQIRYLREYAETLLNHGRHSRNIDSFLEQWYPGLVVRPIKPTVEQKVKILWERSNYFRQLSISKALKKQVVKPQPHYIAYVKDNWRFTVP